MDLQTILSNSHFSFRSGDFWAGLVEPTNRGHIWVNDCTNLTSTSSFKGSWKSSELCFIMKKDIYYGDRKPCQENHSFLCQVPTSKLKWKCWC